ncbi:MAG: rhamnulose-1-phosphate aldolase [Oscillospiraceae bacterium]|nr:rhamnulose-1-phosphate aldolase [Oscillospiraceae bacterium]
MNILKENFMQGFINMCDDANRKGWHERNGGNASYRMSEEEVEAVSACFAYEKPYQNIGFELPNIAGEHFLFTGSGKYFKNIKADPENNLCVIKIDGTGAKYQIVWGLPGGGTPTSETPTHLLNHNVKKETTNGRYRVDFHAHPANIIALTYILPLDAAVFSRELWEMMTECSIIFPDGVGVAGWEVPGGTAIAEATGELIKKYDAVVWAHHGLIALGEDFDSTFGLMETVEKAAEILIKVISCGTSENHKIADWKKQKITKEQFLSLEEPFSININKKFLL